MQPRFERRNGKNPYKLLEHPRFRAGFDFLLLRCESGELDAELGNWWATFYGADIAERERLINVAREPAAGGGPAAAKKRAPRRRGPRKTGDEAGGAAGASGADAGGDEG
jgi:poly(A) polymerase